MPLLLAVAIHASGQDDDTQTELWLSIQHQHKVGEKTRVFGTLGYEELPSLGSFLGRWNKLYVKGGGSYDLGPRFRVAAGVGLYRTYRPEIDDLFEFRLWQEGTAYWPDSPGLVRRLVLTHRLRVEERFTASEESGFAMRLRYRLDSKIPLNKYTLEPRTFYLPLAVEFFADISDGADGVFAEKTRASVGLGYVINKTWTVDMRYHRQGSHLTVEDEFDISSNAIEISVRTSVRIRDLVKGR